MNESDHAPESEFHTMKDGRKIRIADMEDQHLINTHALFKRQALSGVKVCFGWRSDTTGMYYDEYCVFGLEAEEILRVPLYAAELQRRGIMLNNEGT